MLRAAIRPGSPTRVVPSTVRLALRTPAAFRQGLFTNLLNPKIALLFLTLLPQFVGSGEPRLRTTAILAAVFLGLAILWWRLFTLALAPVSRFLAVPRVRRTMMIGISLKVAFEPH
jgi:threonine/homoserine/homoserine lactone efflux protein